MHCFSTTALFGRYKCIRCPPFTRVFIQPFHCNVNLPRKPTGLCMSFTCVAIKNTLFGECCMTGNLFLHIVESVIHRKLISAKVLCYEGLTGLCSLCSAQHRTCMQHPCMLHISVVLIHYLITDDSSPSRCFWSLTTDANFAARAEAL